MCAVILEGSSRHRSPRARVYEEARKYFRQLRRPEEDFYQV
jgi:hypothetical protein